MAFNIILPLTNSQISQATNFTNTQSVIYSAKNLVKKSRPQISQFIVSSINILCEKEVDLKLNFVPTYKEK